METKRASVALALVMIACCVLAAASTQREGKSKGGATAAVTIKNFEFEPKEITVKPGTTVTWTNEAGAHTVTADNGSFDSGTLSSGQTFSRRFSKPGTYRYFCSLHGSKGGHDMAGTVVVKR